MATIDRRSSLASETGLAIKAPALVATTGANITLSGIQVVDGVTVGSASERILVKDQSDKTQNGLYITNSGNWTLAPDAAGNTFWTSGSLVLVTTGIVNGGVLYRQTCTDSPVVIGTSLIAFSAQSQFGGISIAPPTGLGLGINVTQNASGTTPGGEQFLNLITVASDVANAPLGLNYFGVNGSFGGSTVNGTRQAALFQLTQTAPTNASNPFPSYVGMTSIVFTSGAGDGGTNTGAGAKGGYFGANPQVRSSATNCLALVGTESDVFGTSAATQKYQFGVSSVGMFVNAGASLDAAYEIHTGSSAPYGPGIGWGFGLVAAELNNGLPPIAPGGTFIGTHLESLSSIPVAHVIDISKFSASVDQFKGVGVVIDPSGQPTFGDGTAFKLAAINGGNSGTSGGGLLQIKNNGVSLGQFGNISSQLSTAYSPVMGLFGFSGLNLYTNNTLAVTIDTSQNVTVAGTLKSQGDIYSNDATYLIRASTTLTDGHAAQTGTLTNAPAAGNPTKWIAIDDNGTKRQIPAW